jgi:hypothetical protein
MLNLSTYIPSLEEFEEVPSPLMDGNVAPVVEGAIVGQLPTEGFPVPVEQSVVELPPQLDPTPLQPLEEGIIQEEVIAENLDAEAGQLMGAQIALEGYSKLLRSAGKNMTRQSAAFMAVGMQRANRILGVTTLGLENEESGTQVMAMQTAKVDQKGLGDKLKEAGKKIWEWLKAKWAQLVALARKLSGNKEADKQKVLFLIAATKPGKTASLEAPKGLKTAQVLDAIHGDEKRSKPVAKTIVLPAVLAEGMVSNGKLDLNLTTISQLRSKDGLDYVKDSVAFMKDLKDFMLKMTKDTTPEEAGDTISDLAKKHMGGKSAKLVLPGGVGFERVEGKVTFTRSEPGETEVSLPSLPEIAQYLEGINKILNEDDLQEEPVFDELEKMMNFFSGDEAEQADKRLRASGMSNEDMDAITREIEKALSAFPLADNIKAIVSFMGAWRRAAIATMDHLIAAHGGLTGTISQEDFEALPSRGLSVIPGQAGSKQGIGAAVKAAWAKTKEFFARLWEQFRNWIARIWERIFGNEKQVDMLLLTNEAIPDEGQAPSGQPLALPPGTGLKSVSAAKSLAGPSAAGEVPVDVTPEPVVENGSPLPKGYIYTDALKKLKLSSGYAFEPTIEESLITWFTDSYNPAVIKMWRDVTSMANSNFDVGAFDAWGKVLTDMASKVMAGAPVGEIPGGQSLVLNEGTIAFSFGGGDGTESEPVKALNKRQIAQILARQKRAFRGLELAQKSTDEQNRLHEQFSQVIERLINNADEAKASQYSAFYTTVNKLLCNTAVRQLATTIGSRFTARTIVMDEMIAARAKRG